MRTKEQIKCEIKRLEKEAVDLRREISDLEDDAWDCEQEVRSLRKELEDEYGSLDVNAKILEELVPIVEEQGSRAEREALELALRGGQVEPNGLQRLRIMAVQFLHKVLQ